MSQEIFTWGSGAYGRLGHGSLDDYANPQKIGGICNGRTFGSVSCGWYHSACATATGDVLVFGSNVTGCLGMDQEDAFTDSSSEEGDSGDEDPDFDISEVAAAEETEYSELSDLKR
ncbi:unnamed protein product, partial [Amoebophrya sp. A25]|eukprot:GSA25T00013578001.1